MLSRSVVLSMSLMQSCLIIGRVGAFSASRRTLLSSSPKVSRESFHRSLPSQLHSTMREININTMTGRVETDEQLMQDMLFRVRECNQISNDVRETLMNFVVDGTPVGKVTKNVAELLCDSSPTNPVFEITSSSKDDQQIHVLTLSENAGSTVESRTDSVMSVMTNLKSQGIISGWRDELYPVSTGFYNEPKFLVERAASPLLGILSYGVHINGIVKSDHDGTEKMWIARRSLTKSKYPGMTDQLVAGGQPAGLGLMENVLKGKLD